MKILITLIAFCIAINIGYSNTVTHRFTTLGNCYVCKVRIEEAVNKLQGIDSVNWDYIYDVTMVTYSDEEVDLITIMKTIAGVGHDTEWYPANDSAYNFLIGSCCEYVREIDYSQVQVGYLSWEKVWLSVESHDYHIMLYPTYINDGYFILNNASNSTDKLNMKISNLSGDSIYEANIIQDSEERYNISFLTSGIYFINITEKNKNIFSTKIIVQ